MVAEAPTIAAADPHQGETTRACARGSARAPLDPVAGHRYAGSPAREQQACSRRSPGQDRQSPKLSRPAPRPPCRTSSACRAPALRARRSSRVNRHPVVDEHRVEIARQVAPDLASKTTLFRIVPADTLSVPGHLRSGRLNFMPRSRRAGWRSAPRCPRSRREPRPGIVKVIGARRRSRRDPARSGRDALKSCADALGDPSSAAWRMCAK